MQAYNPVSDTLSWAKVKAASLCQSDLGINTGVLVLVQLQTTKFLVVNDFIEQIFSVSKKAVLTQRRGWLKNFPMVFSISVFPV